MTTSQPKRASNADRKFRGINSNRVKSGVSNKHLTLGLSPPPQPAEGGDLFVSFPAAVSGQVLPRTYGEIVQGRLHESARPLRACSTSAPEEEPVVRARGVAPVTIGNLDLRAAPPIESALQPSIPSFVGKSP